MRRAWPLGSPGTELDRTALAAAYAYPDDLTRPFVRLNVVASLDGADGVGGTSAGLACPGDATVFGVLRELADVVLTGAGTVRAEDVRGVRAGPGLRARRRARGQAEVAPVAVVSATCALDPGARLFTDTAVAPLVLTGEAAPADARRRVAGTGAEVEVVEGDGDGDLAPAAILAALERRGLRRVLCEGGARLTGGLVGADLLDEVCLSLAPQLAGGAAGRVVAGPGLDAARTVRLASVIGHDDGLLLRYRTARGDGAAS